MLAKNIRAIHSVILPVLLVLSFTGCGGGSGGDAPPQELVYSGNTNSAVITLENAATLVGNVLYGGEAGTNILAAVTITEEINPRSAGVVVQSKLLHSISQSVQDTIFKNNASLPGLVVGIDLNEPLECDSGSGNLAGTLNDSTFTGALIVTYINCLLDGVTYNGTGTFRIDDFDLNIIEITDATITFKLLSISSPEFTGSMSGSIRIQNMIVSNTEMMTLNYVARDNLTGKMYKFENMIITIVYDQYFSPTSMTETVTGTPARAYDSIHGYVEIDTLTPLAYSSIMLDNPDIDGVMLFKGASGASIRVSVLSGKLIQLDLDIDGAPGYEELRVLLWDELKVNAETNLTDTDNDGMPDSWETTYGLNPYAPDDALLDADTDGVSNYQEYLDRTHPTAVLDQSFIPSPSAAYQGNIIYYPLDSSYVDQAQTFTVGTTGQLTNIEVLIWGFSQMADLIVDIRPTINGIPISDDSAILGKAAIPASEVTASFTFINVDFNSQNIQVTSGSELAIVLKFNRTSQEGGDYSWRGETGDLYTSGVAYSRTSTSDWNAGMSGGLTVDYGFRTFVSTTQ